MPLLHVACCTLLVLVLTCVVNAALIPRVDVPEGWRLGAFAHPAAKVEFTIALRQRNLHVLNELFAAVSEPTHALYQEYMSVDAIRALTAPPADELELVLEWLHANGVRRASVANHGDSLHVSTTVRHASNLLHTHFHVFTHRTTGAQLVRQSGVYSIPDVLLPLIDFVAGLSTLPALHSTLAPLTHASTPATPAPSDVSPRIVPQTLHAQYRITLEPDDDASVNISQGVVQLSASQCYVDSDLKQFAVRSNQPVSNVSDDHLIGYNGPDPPYPCNWTGAEASLDPEMMFGINAGANVTNWYFNNAGAAWLYQFFTAFFNRDDVPQVISISYADSESMQCLQVDNATCEALGINSSQYVARVNTEFQKIGLRGVTIVAGSGDNGANGLTNWGCDSTFDPMYPASSPFITSVGATQLVNATWMDSHTAGTIPFCTVQDIPCAQSGTEEAVSVPVAGWTSGGGFSNISLQPTYQQAAVRAYLDSGVLLPNSGLYNAGGRGFPDVSAVGDRLVTFRNGLDDPLGGGTSASSPIFAGIVALLNIASLEATGKPLGFINPLLYKMARDVPAAFTDITVGDNICGQTFPSCLSSCEGFRAAKGWDPVTGLGTPNFEVMRAYIRKGQHKRK